MMTTSTTLPPPPLDEVARDILGLKRRLGRGDAQVAAELGRVLERARQWFGAHGSRAGYLRFLKDHAQMDEETARRFIAVGALSDRNRVAVQAFAHPSVLFRLAALPPAAFDRLIFDQPIVIPGADAAKPLTQMTVAELDLVLDRLEGRVLAEASLAHEARSLTTRVAALLSRREMLEPEARGELERSIASWVATFGLTPRLTGAADTKETIASRRVDAFDDVAVAVASMERAPGSVGEETQRRLRERLAAVNAMVRGPRPPAGRNRASATRSGGRRTPSRPTAARPKRGGRAAKRR